MEGGDFATIFVFFVFTWVYVIGWGYATQKNIDELGRKLDRHIEELRELINSQKKQ